VDGFPPTGQNIIEIASAVYRIENERIVEYWIQIDREGIRLQLQRNA
ncbi:ester cyclase, partial [Paenibacillus sp. TAF58]